MVCTSVIGNGHLILGLYIPVYNCVCAERKGEPLKTAEAAAQYQALISAEKKCSTAVHHHFCAKLSNVGK